MRSASEARGTPPLRVGNDVGNDVGVEGLGHRGIWPDRQGCELASEAARAEGASRPATDRGRPPAPTVAPG
jgi:hypothetical protein